MFVFLLLFSYAIRSVIKVFIQISLIIIFTFDLQAFDFSKLIRTILISSRLGRPKGNTFKA